MNPEAIVNAVEELKLTFETRVSLAAAVWALVRKREDEEEAETYGEQR